MEGERAAPSDLFHVLGQGFDQLLKLLSVPLKKISSLNPTWEASTADAEEAGLTSEGPSHKAVPPSLSACTHPVARVGFENAEHCLLSHTDVSNGKKPGQECVVTATPLLAFHAESMLSAV